MAKLHEILAVESSQEKSANNMMVESMKTLGKDSLFNGMHRKLTMFREDAKTSEVEEHQEVTTTVDENLDYMGDFVAKYWNTVLQKDRANTEAKVDLVIDGNVIAKNVPATFLLGLENKLTKLRGVYEKIPTLAPGHRWIPDENHEKTGVFQDAIPQVQLKTQKDTEFQVIYEATPEHPAQIAKVERNADVGRYVTTNWSAKLTPKEKADRLARITQLIQFVKRARINANDVVVPAREHLAEKLFGFINR